MANSGSGGGGIGRLLRQVGSGDWLGRVMDSYFNKSSAERWSQPDYTIHPSGCGNPCALSIELGMLGHRGPMKGKNRRRMDNGTDAHTRWERYLHEMGVLVVAEWNVKLVDPVTSGRVDAIIQNSATGDLYLVEVKTTNARKFGELPKPTADPAMNGAVLYKWHREWYLQFAFYLAHTDYNGRRLAGGLFIIENTDDQNYVLVYAKPSAEHTAEAERNATNAQRAILQGEVPSRPFPRGDHACRWCDHVVYCGLLDEGDEDAWSLISGQFKKLKLTLKRSLPGSGPGATP